MLDLVIDIDGITLRLLTKNMKNVPGEKFGTIVMYLKGSLLLLGNCKQLLTDVVGFLNYTFFLVSLPIS